jgi:hypothetical protein
VAGDGGGWADQAAQQKLNAQLTKALVPADGDAGTDLEICAGRETEDHLGHLSRRVIRFFVCLGK